MPNVCVHKVTVTSSATDVTWVSSEVRACIIKQKSTVKVHAKIDDDAVNTGTDCYTLEGVVDRNLPLEFQTLNPKLSLIRDSGAGGNGTVEIWEYEQ